ncbi:MAG: glycosyltransferase involved in cell wall biosynthesis [Candidatus Promineifilaceae bacterium]|jgi:glycosyltransferase involved in cell wall biosynthesis
MSTMRASIAICTHNGESRLPLVLDALMKQTAPTPTWEVLVIDNASIDATNAVCERYAAQGLPLRYIFEKRPGLSYARECAAQNSVTPITCFLDDDNIPDANFVEQVITIFDQYPKMGVAGSLVRPRWQSPPSELTLAVADFALAICDKGPEPVQLIGNAEGVVGAGMCARTSVLKAAMADLMDNGDTKVLDRVGRDLIGGGDTAICILARRAGHEIWYQPTLQIEHVMPDIRTHVDYLMQLYAGIGRGQAALRELMDPRARTAGFRMLLAAKDFLRVFRAKRDLPQCTQTEAVLQQLDRALILARAKQYLK